MSDLTYRPNCPYCNTQCYPAQYVDVGVGYQQVTPHECHNCYAVEISPYAKDKNLTDKEKETGWYTPPKSVENNREENGQREEGRVQ